MSRQQRAEQRRARAKSRREKKIAKHREQLARRGFDLSIEEVKQRAAMLLRTAGVAFDWIEARYWVESEYERDEDGLALYELKPVRETVRCTVKAFRWRAITVPGFGAGRSSSEVCGATAASFPAALIGLRHEVETRARA